MRKVKSREYCNECRTHSEWVFEEREGNQIIECPICTHLHYRVVDGATIDFEIEFKGETIRSMKRINEILSEHPETQQELIELLATLEFGDFSDIKKYSITDRRWGVDPRQRNWTVSSTMVNTWDRYSTTTSTSSSGTYTYRVYYSGTRITST